MSPSTRQTLKALREAFRRDNCSDCGSPLLMDERDNQRCPVCEGKYQVEMNELYAMQRSQRDEEDMSADRPLSSRDDEPF